MKPMPVEDVFAFVMAMVLPIMITMVVMCNGSNTESTCRHRGNIHNGDNNIRQRRNTILQYDQLCE